MKVFNRTFTVENINFPGTVDNPSLPLYFIHPVTGVETLCHSNDRNLITNNDYKDAGFEWHGVLGWCWPLYLDHVPDTYRTGKDGLNWI